MMWASAAIAKRPTGRGAACCHSHICNIHATEIASSQLVMERAHRLAPNDTRESYLKHTVVLLIPSMNLSGLR